MSRPHKISTKHSLSRAKNLNCPRSQALKFDDEEMAHLKPFSVHCWHARHSRGVKPSSAYSRCGLPLIKLNAVRLQIKSRQNRLDVADSRLVSSTSSVNSSLEDWISHHSFKSSSKPEIFQSIFQHQRLNFSTTLNYYNKKYRTRS